MSVVNSVVLTKRTARRVSVVIPAYNAAAFISETIESVLEQTYPYLEVIVVDDGSTDNTRGVLQRYDGRLRLESQPNSGVTEARNVGIRMASGELIALLDHDDLWLPDKVACQVACFEADPSLGVCFTNYDWFGQSAPYPSGFDEVARQFERLPRRRIAEASYLITAPLLKEFILRGTNPCLTSAVMIRKEVFRKAGLFYEQRGIRGVERKDVFPEDIHLWLRLAKHSAFAYVDRVLVRRRLRDPWTQPRPVELERRIFQRVLEMYETLGEWIPLSLAEQGAIRTTVARIGFSAGYFEFSLGCRDAARRLLLGSLRHRLCWRTLTYLLLAVLPDGPLRFLRSVKRRATAGRLASSLRRGSA